MIKPYKSMIHYRTVLLLVFIGLIWSPISAQDDAEATEQAPPPQVGVLRQTDGVSDGYVLFSPIPSNIAYLIDNDGRLVHQWQTEFPILSPYLLENGDLLATTTLPSEGQFPAGRTGRIVRLNWDGDVIWQYELEEQSNEQIHHDIDVMPNGHILMSIWEAVSYDDLATYGIDTTALEPDSTLYYDKIVEIDPASNETIWEWRMLDHTVQSFDESRDNFGVIAANPHLIDLNYNERTANTRDRSHINAIDYDAEHNHIIISAHFQSEIWVIDYNTGDLIYRWGNPQVYDRGLPDNQQLFGQHNPTWLDNGNILIFNNGHADLRPYSSVIEITPPRNAQGGYDLLDGAAYAPFEPTWEYAPNDADEFYARNLSGAHRLMNGNTFITDGPNGRFVEIDADGMVVWEYLSPFWSNNENPRPVSIFRATRYPANYLAFEGRDLIAGNVLPYRIR